jgi:haloalkane dehalogenase
MNAFYGESPGLRVPEFIELFANKNLKALTRHFLASPQQFARLLNFQGDQMQVGMTETQKARYNEFLGPIVDKNCTRRPSAGPAFGQMTDQLFDEIAANTARLVDFRRSDLPLLLIWGKADPYLHVSVAQHLRSQAKNAAIHAIEAGRWPQIEEAVDTARIMLASQWC